MTVIDHQSFPHIIDAIWASMDLVAVLVTRTVSNEWLRRGNEWLRRHMLLESPDAFEKRIKDTVQTQGDSRPKNNDYRDHCC